MVKLCSKCNSILRKYTINLWSELICKICNKDKYNDLFASETYEMIVR